MAHKLKHYKNKVAAALKKAGTYSEGLDMQVQSLASALRTLDIATDEIDELTEVTVEEVTRYGSRMVPHPAFKVQKDAQDSITRQMKVLGLTASELAGDVDSDPLVELTSKLTEEGKDKIIRRKKAAK